MSEIVLKIFLPRLLGGPFERQAYRVEQRLLAERFGEKSNGPRPHRLLAAFPRSVSRDEDNRNPAISLGQVALQFRAAHAGQAQIENEATGFLELRAIEEFQGGAEAACLEPIRLQEADGCLTD